MDKNSGFPRSVLLALTALLAVSLTPAFAQSLITGDIQGTIMDASGAVIAGANVELKSLDTGAMQKATSSTSGTFRFTLLKPGPYQVSVGQAGFKTASRQVDVSVGQAVSVDITLEVGQATQTVEVTEKAALLSPETSNNTTFTSREVALLPAAGGDITNIAFTAPGVVVNSTGGYGNFTVNGLPATSNLFTVNGENNMDPYFNINNSGASNLTLGQNEMEEVTIVTNAYSGQFGQLSGAQVTGISKSGSNQFHGNAQYWWNGRLLNANDWFNNLYGVDRPFSNANQWATSVGGPIIKNKTFFFADFEGLRFVLPNVFTVTIPSQAFASAVLANVKVKQPNEYATYQSMMNLWLNAPGNAAAQPIANSSSCNSLVLPGFNPATQPCATRFNSSANALGSEWFLTGRIDQRVGNNDSMFYRYKVDHGLQPTSLSPISPAFAALSNQPEWDNQFNETHIFGPTASNNFMATFSHYVAQFQQNESLALSTFPTQIVTSGAVPFTGFNPVGSFPQGRNITQYQFIDDFTKNLGRHDLKFGVNFRRYDVSDHNFFFNNPAVYFGYTSDGLQNFANGLAYQYRKSLNLASDVPIALWGMGVYAQDEWRVTPQLKLTLALRLEHNSNPVCQFNCLSNFTGDWSTLASVNSSNPGSVPYSADINSGLHQAFKGLDVINYSPRVGFSWSPSKDNKTVISGGVGIFYDSIPAGLVDDLLSNPPATVAIRVRPSSGVLPFDPAGGPATWAASANAFSLSKTYSQIAAQLAALGSTFAAPSFTSLNGTFHTQQFQQWNFQIQRQLNSSMAFIANYSGNHGIHIPYTNAWPNAFDEFGLFIGPAGNGIPGVNAGPLVPNYGTVTQVQSGANSSYHGLSLTLRKQFSHGFVAHFNYTWSHALDEVSNGGVFTYGDSLLGQINPLSLRANNYGNADYDIRHNFTADWVYTPKFTIGNHFVSGAVNGWMVSGKLFWRTGLPFSVTDNNWALGNGGGTLLAVPIGGVAVQPTACGEAAVNGSCINANAFVNSGDPNFQGYTAWSPQTRNQFRGPHLFDMDMAVMKGFPLFTERVHFSFGIQAFNILNHPNFGLPDSGLGDPTFGQITGLAGSPTSPYGVFLGYDSAPRTLQVTGKIVF